jgi:purine nucleoside phosphorylase
MEKNGKTMSLYEIHELFIDFKKAYDSVRREVLYNIITELRVSMKLVRLIKTCSNET